jgi:hypothetical protein
MTMNDTIERVARALVVLARYNVPPDIQGLLVNGGGFGNVRPGALAVAIEDTLSSLRPGDELPNGMDVQQGWQPIETAPKDGTDILVFGLWKPSWKGAEPTWAVARCRGPERSDWYGLGAMDEPLYWRPLSKPHALHCAGASK